MKGIIKIVCCILWTIIVIVIAIVITSEAKNRNNSETAELAKEYADSVASFIENGDSTHDWSEEIPTNVESTFDKDEQNVEISVEIKGNSYNFLYPYKESDGLLDVGVEYGYQIETNLSMTYLFIVIMWALGLCSFTVAIDLASITETK